MDKTELIFKEKEKFFEFMSEKYHVIYRSNIFLRDIQYAIFLFFRYRNEDIKSDEAERIAFELTEKLTETGELKKLSDNTWLVNFEIKSVVLEENEDLSEE